MSTQLSDKEIVKVSLIQAALRGTKEAVPVYGLPKEWLDQLVPGEVSTAVTSCFRRTKGPHFAYFAGLERYCYCDCVPGHSGPHIDCFSKDRNQNRSSRKYLNWIWVDGDDT